jgi:hypothetical protein
MNHSEERAATKQLLQQHYNLSSENLPEQREKSKWTAENKFGFLMGVVEHGLHTHITQLHSLLQNNQFKDQEESFIDSLFDFYIRPFHKSYIAGSEFCQTPTTGSSRTPSRTNSAEDLDYTPEEREMSHKDLKKAVVRRDGVCLFCWNRRVIEGAHIIAQKSIPIAYDGNSLLQRAGLSQKHQVENGLLLCQICHSQFDLLLLYVDVVDDKLVVKVVNQANDPHNILHQQWLDSKDKIRLDRENEIIFKSNLACKDGRVAVETNGEMALYFVLNDPSILPNRVALEFHKASCLIWRMAGGAEPDEDEYCSDDEQGPVDTAALRKRFNLPAQDSSSTLLESNVNKVA